MVLTLRLAVGGGREGRRSSPSPSTASTRQLVNSSLGTRKNWIPGSLLARRDETRLALKKVPGSTRMEMYLDPVSAPIGPQHIAAQTEKNRDQIL